MMQVMERTAKRWRQKEILGCITSWRKVTCVSPMFVPWYHTLYPPASGAVNCLRCLGCLRGTTESFMGSLLLLQRGLRASCSAGD